MTTERRTLLKMIAAATGTAVVGADAVAYVVLEPIGDVPAATGFSADDIALLDEIAETILPETDTPGARAAQTGSIMAVIAADCYSAPQQALFREGLDRITAQSRAQFGVDFMAASAAQRLELLSALDSAANAHNREHDVHAGPGRNPVSLPQPPEVPLPHYFTLFKQLALFGFFTSEPGATAVLRHVEIPARYDGDMPYKKGDRAWATS